jgi:DHA2 family multidrug resistance protein-like MFS transporter
MAMFVLMAAGALAALEATITNTALPQISAALQVSEATVIWVANAYQIAVIAALLPFASLGESVGYRRVFIAGLALFTAGSLASGLVDSLGWLVVGRAVQGVGAAAIMSVTAAFIRHLYAPESLGKGLSLHALVVAVAFTLGPMVASAIVTVTSWHWLFLINVPIAPVVFVGALYFLPDAQGKGLRFEGKAAILCSVFLGLLTFGFCSIENGSGSATGVSALAGAALCLLVLLKLQRSHPAPMLAVDLLRVPTIGLSSPTSISAFATQALAFIALPFVFQNEMGISVASTGLILTPWPIAVAIMALIAGRLSDRIAPGVLCSFGLTLLAAGMAALAMIDSETSRALLVVLLALCGAGFGLFQAPNMKAIMGSSPSDRSGGASGIIAISRLLGQTCGAALVAQCFHISHQQGPGLALWLGCGCATIGAIFSALRLRQAHA